jgi:hypothetical protein
MLGLVWPKIIQKNSGSSWCALCFQVFNEYVKSYLFVKFLIHGRLWAECQWSRSFRNLNEMFMQYKGSRLHPVRR